jgi:hypothetical protein
LSRNRYGAMSTIVVFKKSTLNKGIFGYFLYIHHHFYLKHSYSSIDRVSNQIQTFFDIFLLSMTRYILGIAGLIQFMPITGIWSSKLPKLYGIQINDQNISILLQHRAVLFGITGLSMMYSAYSHKNITESRLVGLASMGSFVLLCGYSGGSNSALTKIMWIDIAALGLLLLDWLL